MQITANMTNVIHWQEQINLRPNECNCKRNIHSKNQSKEIKTKFFIPFTGKLWVHSPSLHPPPSWSCNPFKRGISKYTRILHLLKVACFIFSFFFNFCNAAFLFHTLLARSLSLLKKCKKEKNASVVIFHKPTVSKELSSPKIRTAYDIKVSSVYLLQVSPTYTLIDRSLRVGEDEQPLPRPRL